MSSHISSNTNLNINSMNNPNNPNNVNMDYDNLLFGNNVNEMDFLMSSSGLNGSNIDINQFTSNMNMNNINMSSPVLDFQHNSLVLTPSLGALTNLQFDLSANSTTPHLPPLNIEGIDANSHINSTNNTTTNIDEMIETELTQFSAEEHAQQQSIQQYPYLPQMPHLGTTTMDNIPPPTDNLDWNTFYSLIQQNNSFQSIPQNHEEIDIDFLINHNENIQNNIINNKPQQQSPSITTTTTTTTNTRKRKKMSSMENDEEILCSSPISSPSPTKKRRLNNDVKPPKKKKKGRGRPRKNPSVTIKKEKKDKKSKKKNSSPNMLDENG
eukprot:433211_1